MKLLLPIPLEIILRLPKIRPPVSNIRAYQRENLSPNSLKFDYFNDQEWEQRYKQRAKDAIEDVYKEYRDAHAADITVNIGTAAQAPPEDEYTAVFVRKSTRTQHTGRELDQYLKDPCAPPTCDVLLWWRNHVDVYPVLSLIACDYLAIQASSVPSERVFSSCGHLITPKRSCLHRDTVSKSMFVKHCVRSRRQPTGAMIYSTLLDEK